MNRYPALKTIGSLTKFLAVLIGAAIAVFGGIGGAIDGNAIVAMLSLLVGLLVGLSFYAAGEFIALMVAIAEDIRLSTNAQVKTYMKREQRAKGKER